jgi:hypothetical protein
MKWRRSSRTYLDLSHAKTSPSHRSETRPADDDGRKTAGEGGAWLAQALLVLAGAAWRSSSAWAVGIGTRFPRQPAVRTRSRTSSAGDHLAGVAQSLEDRG